VSKTPVATITFFSAAHLFSIGHAALERLKDAPERDSGNPDACVAILFAAASLEAFANEVGYLAREPLQANPEIRSLGDLFEELEFSASIQSKFLLLRALIAKRPYDKGTSPYQDFSLLIALRNELVHRKAERYEVDAADAPLTSNTLLDRLRSKNITAEPRAGPNQVWGLFLAIETRAVARWALNAAAAMMKDVAASAPQELRSLLEVRYALILNYAAV
jgi:hypothetical protein